MKKQMQFLILLVLSTVIFSTKSNAQELPDNIDISSSPNGIVALPSSVPAIFASNGFVKYTKIQCPNGEAIHFIAQDLISDAQILYCKTLLEFYLTDFEGAQYGTDKTAVKNTMGTNNAMLMLVNGTHIEGQEPNIYAQPLYQNEIAVPGHTWYQTNDYDNHRDAAFEEILHLMHDMGIGVDGTPEGIPNAALPAFQTEIRAAQNNAISNNYAIWPKGATSDPGWYNELAQENSLSQEYLASLIDSYYGLWGAWTEDPNTGMWGEYIAHTRAEIETEDPMGWALVPKYFSPFVNVDMIIDPTFNGIFSMTFNDTDPYTYKSQYLQHCYLDGTNHSGLRGNEEYNRLTGNAGNNSFEGLKGNDRLDGNGGSNTAIFTGDFSEYTVNNLTSYAIVTDGISNRDGVDTLWNMHFLQFSDQTVPVTLETTADIIEKNPHTFQASVYPNPTKESISIEVPENQNAFEFEIRDITGQLLYSRKVTHSTSTLVNVSDYSPGIYFVNLKSTEGSNAIKFVKQ
jgi:hypothetical protein